MCGIVGYTGKQSVAKQILDALELLEYRGYDSAGMAIVDETNGQVQIRKRAGRVADLEKVWKAIRIVQDVSHWFTMVLLRIMKS